MVLVAIGGSSTSTLAADYTTQDLLQDCRAENKSFCMGYLAGAAGILLDLHDHGTDTVPTKQENVRLVVSACPAGVTFGAMRQAFINWAEKHPKEWVFSASNGAKLALQETWPCRK
jgi:Rap1a immunity proteins